MRLILDVDGVLADFPAQFIKQANKLGLGHNFPARSEDVTHWGVALGGDRKHSSEVWETCWHDEVFWLQVPAFDGVAYELYYRNVVPAFYLTSRPCRSEVTAEWLRLNNFPEAPVVTVKHAPEKLEYIQNGDVLVDDLIETVRLVKNSKPFAYPLLWKAPYQKGRDVSDLTVVSSIGEVADICRSLTESKELELNQSKSYGHLTPVELFG